MRHPRIKATGEGFYHVVSRIVGRRFLLDDGEKGTRGQAKHWHIGS